MIFHRFLDLPKELQIKIWTQIVNNVLNQRGKSMPKIRWHLPDLQNYSLAEKRRHSSDLCLCMQSRSGRSIYLPGVKSSGGEKYGWDFVVLRSFFDFMQVCCLSQQLSLTCWRIKLEEGWAPNRSAGEGWRTELRRASSGSYGSVDRAHRRDSWTINSRKS